MIFLISGKASNWTLCSSRWYCSPSYSAPHYIAGDPDLSASYRSFCLLNQSPLYELYWTVNDSRVFCAVRVETTGWVGLGISPNGSMLDSDAVMGFVDDITGGVTLEVS